MSYRRKKSAYTKLFYINYFFFFLFIMFVGIRVFFTPIRPLRPLRPFLKNHSISANLANKC